MAKLRAVHANQESLRKDILVGYDSDDENNYVTKEISVETIRWKYTFQQEWSGVQPKSTLIKTRNK